MQIRTTAIKWGLLVLALAVSVLGYLAARDALSEPKPIVIVTTSACIPLHGPRGEELQAFATLGNEGRNVMKWWMDMQNGTLCISASEVQVETSSGWTNYGTPGTRQYEASLPPGRYTGIVVLLPTNALRWKMTLPVSSKSWLVPDRGRSLSFQTPAFEVKGVR